MAPGWDDDIFFDPSSGKLDRGTRAGSTYSVNCPHCGEIVGAVCPRPGDTPRSVSAHGFLGLLFSHETFQEPTRMTCPDCGRFMVVRWLF